MNDEATLRVFRLTSAAVERKQACVDAMLDNGETPSAKLIADLDRDADFLAYLNEVIRTP